MQIETRNGDPPQINGISWRPPPLRGVRELPKAAHERGCEFVVYGRGGFIQFMRLNKNVDWRSDKATHNLGVFMPLHQASMSILGN